MNTKLPTNKEDKMKYWSASKVVREISAIALWLFIFIKVIVLDIDVYLFEKYAPSFRWILDYRFFGLLILLSAILIAVSKKPFRLFLVYVTLYPCIIMFWRIPKLIFRNWALTIAFAPAIYEVISSFRFRFVFITIVSLFALCIILSSSPYLLFPAMVFLGLYLTVILYRNLRRAYQSSIFKGLSDLVIKLRLKLERGEHVLWKKVEHDPDTEKFKKAYEEQLSLFYVLNWCAEFIVEKLYIVAKNRT